MKEQVRRSNQDPIVVDDAATCFGTEGAAFSVKTPRRGNGTLTLTEDSLVFRQPATGLHLTIPLDSIERLGVGYWHNLRASMVPLLKVTYRKNLVLGVIVSRPERWIEAIQTLTDRRGLAVQVDPYPTFRTDSKRYRVIVGAGLLLVILIVSGLLPMIFSWVHGATVRSRQSDPPALAAP